MSASPDLAWPLGVTLAGLLVLALAATRAGRIGIESEVVAAVLRAAVQLAVVAAIITAVLEHTALAVLFACVMFAIAVFTAAGRGGVRPDWPWMTVALASGVVPVLGLIFAVRATAFSAPAVVAIAGIIIGGSMTAGTLTTRRAFDALRTERGQVEAAMALGLARPAAIDLVIGRYAREAVIPGLDLTRTVGLVTLPGAFVGVLLGGGTATEAAAAQLLVLVGLLAAQTLVVTMLHRLIGRALIMPADLLAQLPPA